MIFLQAPHLRTTLSRAPGWGVRSHSKKLIFCKRPYGDPQRLHQGQNQSRSQNQNQRRSQCIRAYL